MSYECGPTVATVYVGVGTFVFPFLSQSEQRHVCQASRPEMIFAQSLPRSSMIPGICHRSSS